MSKFIINREQIEARCKELRNSNPNLKRIEEISEQIRNLSEERSKLISNEEKYYNILSFLSTDFDKRSAAISLMSNQELAEHLSHLFFEFTNNEMDEGILLEVMDRLGYKSEDDE